MALLPPNESTDITKEQPKEKENPQPKTESKVRPDKQKERAQPAKVQKPRPAQRKARPGFEGGPKVTRVKKSEQ